MARTRKTRKALKSPKPITNPKAFMPSPMIAPLPREAVPLPTHVVAAIIARHNSITSRTSIHLTERDILIRFMLDDPQSGGSGGAVRMFITKPKPTGKRGRPCEPRFFVIFRRPCDNHCTMIERLLPDCVLAPKSFETGFMAFCRLMDSKACRRAAL